jgi:hypothetical protein
MYGGAYQKSCANQDSWMVTLRYHAKSYLALSVSNFTDEINFISKVDFVNNINRVDEVDFIHDADFINEVDFINES